MRKSKKEGLIQNEMIVWREYGEERVVRNGIQGWGYLKNSKGQNPSSSTSPNGLVHARRRKG